MAHCREEAPEKQLRESHLSHFSRLARPCSGQQKTGNRNRKDSVGSFVEFEMARNDVHQLELSMANRVQQEGVEHVQPCGF